MRSTVIGVIGVYIALDNPRRQSQRRPARRRLQRFKVEFRQVLAIDPAGQLLLEFNGEAFGERGFF